MPPKDKIPIPPPGAEPYNVVVVIDTPEQRRQRRNDVILGSTIGGVIAGILVATLTTLA